MYIHGSSTDVDYSFFFYPLILVLDAPSPPLVGSNDEKAIKKAVSQELLAKRRTALFSQTFVLKLCRMSFMEHGKPSILQRSCKLPL